MDRKEAIEIIIKNYHHVSNSGSQFESALRELIPELKESEDEKILNEIIEFLRCSFYVQDSGLDYEKIGNWIYWLEKQKDNKFVPRVLPCSAAWFEDGEEFEQKGQKPAEWSEEDEALIDAAVVAIEDFYGKSNPICAAKIINRLKAFLPRPHWKPNEEQIKALESAIPIIKNCMAGMVNHSDVLTSLYEQLKSL